MLFPPRAFLHVLSAQYPGVAGNGFERQSNYSEGLLIGYRWYEKAAFMPAFPFGHGLTYGTFVYSGLTVTGRNVSFTIARGTGAGCDTPQLYLSAPTAKSDPTVPVKVLRHFLKVCDATTPVTFTISDSDVSGWDIASASWKIVPGVYGISIGSSSADIRLTATITV